MDRTDIYAAVVVLVIVAGIGVAFPYILLEQVGDGGAGPVATVTGLTLAASLLYNVFL